MDTTFKMPAVRTEDRWDYTKMWFWDNNDQYQPQWKVRLDNGDIIRPGRQVYVMVEGRERICTVKQVAGFGHKEDRPVISVVFPGRAKGTKIHIADVIRKV